MSLRCARYACSAICAPMSGSSHCNTSDPNLLGLNLTFAHSGQPVPLSARLATLVIQPGCSGSLLQIHHALYRAPRVTSLADFSFLSRSHSLAKSGLSSVKAQCCTRPFLSA